MGGKEYGGYEGFSFKSVFVCFVLIWKILQFLINAFN